MELKEQLKHSISHADALVEEYFKGRRDGLQIGWYEGYAAAVRDGEKATETANPYSKGEGE